MRSNTSKKMDRRWTSAMAIGGLAALFTLAAANQVEAEGDLNQRRGGIRPPVVQPPGAPALDPREVMVPIDPPQPLAPRRSREPVRESPTIAAGASEPGTSWVHRLLARLSAFDR